LFNACLIEKDFAVATVIEGGEEFADDFQYDGSHPISPVVSDLISKITQGYKRFQTRYGS
jgi:hypothetical protein